jgi:ubiquitin carboxyl-terminal hydrolase 25
MRKWHSQKMVLEVRNLFASLMLTNQKYVDPTAVLNSVVDDYDNVVQVGEQADVIEYLLNFIERLEDGLLERKADGSLNDVSVLES